MGTRIGTPERWDTDLKCRGTSSQLQEFFTGQLRKTSVSHSNRIQMASNALVYDDKISKEH